MIPAFIIYENFDPYYYLRMNDLVHLNLKTKEDVYKHWLTDGCYQGLTISNSVANLKPKYDKSQHKEQIMIYYHKKFGKKTSKLTKTNTIIDYKVFKYNFNILCLNNNNNIKNNNNKNIKIKKININNENNILGLLEFINQFNTDSEYDYFKYVNENNILFDYLKRHLHSSVNSIICNKECVYNYRRNEVVDMFIKPKLEMLASLYDVSIVDNEWKYLSECDFICDYKLIRYLQSFKEANKKVCLLIKNDNDKDIVEFFGEAIPNFRLDNIFMIFLGLIINSMNLEIIQI